MFMIYVNPTSLSYFLLLRFHSFSMQEDLENGLYNLDIIQERFYSQLKSYCEMIPVRKVTLRADDKPWITPITKSIIYDKWKAYKQRNFIKYKYLKDKVKREIKKAVAIWINKASFQKNNRGVWNLIKAYNNTDSHIRPSNDNNFSFPDFKINELADYFNTNTSNDNQQNTARAYNPNVKQNCVDTWPPNFCEENVLSVLNKVKVNKAIGPDNFNLKIIKILSPFIALPLAHYFNAICQSSFFPSNWKKYYVIPLPKKKKTSSYSDYRPIALLDFFSKIFEKSVFSYLKSHLNIYKYYPKKQFGFRANSDTTCALITLHNTVTSMLDTTDTKGVSILAIDITKAFDNVAHHLIISTLLELNFPIGFVNLYNHYLQHRTFQVKIGDSLSLAKDIRSGVPQGSIISPMIFNLFFGNINLNDYKPENDFNYICYADDLTLILRHIDYT